MNLGIKKPLIATAVGLLAIGVACSSGSTPQETTFAAAIEVATPATLAGAPASARPAELKVGNKVGDHAPEYALSLVGGSTVTSESLVGESRPVFLFFMATW